MIKLNYEKIIITQSKYILIHLVIYLKKNFYIVDNFIEINAMLIM